MRTGRRVAAACALVLVFSFGAAGCRRGPKTETFPGAPVFLVSVDTLRSDHLPAYGYAGVETPALDALRKDSILFARAFSHVPLTLPSHASIFTGREPSAHGIHDNLGYRLKADVPTLAELLKKAGYETGAAVSCFVLKGAASGISRGFDFYDDAVDAAEGQLALGRVQRAGPDTEARLETWLAARPTNGRLFAFLHLYEPHTPYEPPEPFKTRYAARPYDGEIAEADAIVGKFLAFLKARGLYDKSVVVFLSDHGEGLGDHGESEHGMFLYRESLQVPLFVKLPGEPASRRNRRGAGGAQRRLHDSRGGRGRPGLLAARRDAVPPRPAGRPARGASSPRRSSRGSTSAGATSRRSTTGGGTTSTPRGPRSTTSPRTRARRSNLYAAEARRAAARCSPRSAKRKPAYESAGDLDPEARKKLASLGYLSAGPSSANAGTLDDPKDRIRTFEELRMGLGEFTAGNAAKAHAVFQKLLAENPRMLDVWDMDSKALIQLGKPEEALARAQEDGGPRPRGRARAVPPRGREPVPAARKVGRGAEARRGAPRARGPRRRGHRRARLPREGRPRRRRARGPSGVREGLGEDEGARRARPRPHRRQAERPRRRAEVVGRGGGPLRRTTSSSSPGSTCSAATSSRGRAGRRRRRRSSSRRSASTRTAWTRASRSPPSTRPRAGGRTRAGRSSSSSSRQPTPEAFLLAMKTFRVTEDPKGESEMRREGKRRFPSDPRF